MQVILFRILKRTSSQMANAFEISDSTDWLATALPTLATVESALRCQVCKDFYTTPVITSCSHSFCSLCIRRCLTVEGKCPTCRGPEQEVKLRKNWALQEIVDAFQAARPGVMKLARQGNDEADKRRPTKRKLDDMKNEEEEVERPSQARKTRSSTRSSAHINTIDDGGNYNHSDDGLVSCPICSKRMKEENVYTHLDRCGRERETKKSTDPIKSTASSSTLSRGTLQTKPLQTPKRLPKLSYSIFKDNALRKKMSELGLNSMGPKSLLERRHTEWVNLWNANCDSLRPKSKRELLQDLDTWERSQGGSVMNSLVHPGLGSDVMKKDFDGAGWAKSHDEEFQKLISNARRKKAFHQHSQKTETPPSEEIGIVQTHEGGDVLAQSRSESTYSPSLTDKDLNLLAEEIERQETTQEAAPTDTSLSGYNREISHSPMKFTTPYRDPG
ncbi:MAG: E3 ubiquitin-protein ligase rad18 [Geoglossum simile]|nr:MAG: E3 ubiquitin-protein ligase rad18 [Geoglossum simile]